jgi:hypothetical protein
MFESGSLWMNQTRRDLAGRKYTLAENDSILANDIINILAPPHSAFSTTTSLMTTI